jgi:hypothetical protein
MDLKKIILTSAIIGMTTITGCNSGAASNNPADNNHGNRTGERLMDSINNNRTTSGSTGRAIRRNSSYNYDRAGNRSSGYNYASGSGSSSSSSAFTGTGRSSALNRSANRVNPNQYTTPAARKNYTAPSRRIARVTGTPARVITQSADRINRSIVNNNTTRSSNVQRTVPIVTKAPARSRVIVTPAPAKTRAFVTVAPARTKVARRIAPIATKNAVVNQTTTTTKRSLTLNTAGDSIVKKSSPTMNRAASGQTEYTVQSGALTAPKNQYRNVSTAGVYTRSRTRNTDPNRVFGRLNPDGTPDIYYRAGGAANGSSLTSGNLSSDTASQNRVNRSGSNRSSRIYGKLNPDGTPDIYNNSRVNP